MSQSVCCYHISIKARLEIGVYGASMYCFDLWSNTIRQLSGNIFRFCLVSRKGIGNMDQQHVLSENMFT